MYQIVTQVRPLFFFLFLLFQVKNMDQEWIESLSARGSRRVCRGGELTFIGMPIAVVRSTLKRTDTAMYPALTKGSRNDRAKRSTGYSPSASSPLEKTPTNCAAIGVALTAGRTPVHGRML